MADIGLISCVSTKKNVPTEAGKLYISPLFLYTSNYAQKILDRFYILSAKYGLLTPDQIIEPYEETLNNKNLNERVIWSNNVFKQITKEISINDRIVFLAGEKYKEILNDLLIKHGYKTQSPLNRMSIGRQLQWFKSFSKNENRLKDIEILYSIIEKLKKGLGDTQSLSSINGAEKLPQKGVYLFFEDGEYRTTKPFTKRVTRVGTHAVSEGSSSTLWNRLRTHRGGNDLKGNHRGSIFRLHVGNSLINKYNLYFPNWGIGQNADQTIKRGEIELECKVSEYIGKMQVLWLNIVDKASKYSDRAYLEKNLIAILSSFDYKLDIASDTWLGNFNINKFIKRSGLWNVNYVDLKYDPRFFEILDFYVDVTIGKKPTPDNSIVPIEWHKLNKNNQQLKLFE